MTGDTLRNTLTLTAATFMAHFLTGGISYCLGVYYVTFLEVFQETNGVTSWIGSLNTGTLCATGPLASYMIHRIGSRYTVMIGGLVASSGIVLGAYSPNIFLLFISFGVITGIGYGMTFTTGVVVIGVATQRHRTIAMGASLAGIGCGNFVYPFIATHLMEVYGWRGALLITSAITLHVCVLGMFMDGIPGARFGGTQEAQDSVIEKDYDGVVGSRLLPSGVDRVMASHSVQSLHLLLSRRFCDEIRLEKTRSSEAIFDRKSRSWSNVKIFSSVQGLNQHSQPNGQAMQISPVENEFQKKALCDKEKYAFKLPAVEVVCCDDTETETKSALLLSDSDVDCDDLNVNMSSNHMYAFTLYQYWMLHVNIILFCVSLSVVLTHIFAYAQHHGLSEGQAAFLISMNGASNIVGRVLLSFIIARNVNPFVLYIVCYVIAGVACVFVTVWTTFPGFVVCTTTYGFFNAAFGPVLCEVTLAIVGVENFNFGYGFLMISMAMGTTLGAPTAGWLYDITGQYASSFYLGGASLIVSALMMLPPAVNRKIRSTSAALQKSAPGHNV